MYKGIIAIILIVSFVSIGLLLMSSSRLQAAELTLNEIIKLVKADVGDEVIKAHIKVSGVQFKLTTEDILKLKKIGASNDLIAFLIAGGDGSESRNKDDFPLDIGDNLLVQAPISYKHLSIFPITRKKPVDLVDYLSLDEAMGKKVIIVNEKEGGSVPVLMIKNIGNKPIYLMAGEVIKGGKQDRMLSFDVIIYPQKNMTVSVRCVEQGRWRGGGKFGNARAIGNKGTRSAVQFSTQTRVWEEVSKVAKKQRVRTSTGSLTAVTSNTKIAQNSQPYLKAVISHLKDKSMVGMLVAINGKVVCCDIFVNPKLFAKVKEKLLKAYVLDALSTETKVTTPPDKKEILEAFEKAKKSHTSLLKEYDNNRNFKKNAPGFIGNEGRDEEGQWQHRNYYFH
jgi:hypothetical protein